MINRINNINLFYTPTYTKNTGTDRSLMPLNHNSVNFTGMSRPHEYKTTFDYLAAQIINANKKYNIDGSQLSSKKIGQAVQQLLEDPQFFKYKKSNPRKIIWKNYIPQDIREYCTNKINEARDARLSQWKKFITTPYEEMPESVKSHKLKTTLRNNPSLRFVIWHSINSEIGERNRHIPVPLEINALFETVKAFDNLYLNFRQEFCTSTSFLDMYTHRLKEDTLDKLGFYGKKSVWVKIPSFRNDPHNKELNIRNLEILSDKNWCTRSSVDKAIDALTDGNFYLYLEKDETTKLWKTLVGMTSAEGKIDQIQGPLNNNTVPFNQIDNIKNYIKENNLSCKSGLNSEKPDALQQLLIAEKLLEFNQTAGKNLDTAIKKKDSYAIFQILGNDVKIIDDTLQISTYKPCLMVSEKSGIIVPYSYAGIDENTLLENVSVINGDFIMKYKNGLFNTRITNFPPKLQKVTGNIICSPKQYELYKEDMLRVVDNDIKRIIIKTV